MLVKEFKRNISSDVESFLDEREVETYEKAAWLADEYTLTHKISFVHNANPRKPFYPPSGPKSSPSLHYGNSSHNTLKPKPAREKKGHDSLSQPVCNYCRQSGHIVSDCPEKKTGKATGF